MKHFAINLRLARTRKRLTQAELSRRTKIPEASISHYETGHRKPSVNNLAKLAFYLDCSMDHLWGPWPDNLRELGK